MRAQKKPLQKPPETPEMVQNAALTEKARSGLPVPVLAVAVDFNNVDDVSEVIRENTPAVFYDGEETQPTDSNPLAFLINGGFTQIDIADTKKTGLRTEWRKNANTGKLRGVAFRERNKERKSVRYVGERSVGSRKAEYERYARAYAARYDQSGSVGNPLDGGRSIGNDEAGALIPLPDDWKVADRTS